MCGMSRRESRQIPAGPWTERSLVFSWVADGLAVNAAQLGLNKKLQQAAVCRACRVFTWQICSPDNGARLICASSPYGPDLTAALRAVAAMPSAPQ